LPVPAQHPGDDAALVLAVQEGDLDAFDALFRRHYPTVRRACARRLVDPFEADEVAQAAFVRALERIDQCGGDRRFGPWVHVIARSLCMDAFRAHARVEPHEDPAGDRRARHLDEPEELLLSRERAAHVQEALAALPERQRWAVLARDWENLRPGEIADRLGVSVGAVDSLVLRARRRLALSYRRLAGEGGGGASTRTLRTAAAATGLVIAAGQHAVVTATAAAAAVVQDTATRAGSGVVGAVISVALTLGGGSPVSPVPPVPDHAPVVTVVTTVPAAASTRPVVPASPAAPSPSEPSVTPTPTSVVPEQGTASPPASSRPSTTTTTTPPPPPSAPASAPGPVLQVTPTVSVPPALTPVTDAVAPVAQVAQVDPKALDLPPVTVPTPTVPGLPVGVGRPAAAPATGT
jgi:RNA polymerase sigma-70 factor (ECF subfamily)